jgi:folate-binding protein YgfZ
VNHDISNNGPSHQECAAREGCAIVDLSDRAQLEITGADRATFLHNFCTQEIKRLPSGAGAEAFITSVKGRVLGHVLVFAGESSLVLDCSPGTAASLLTHLERYIITEDVTLTDRTATRGELGLIGPDAGRLADEILPGSGAFAAGQHATSGAISVRRFDLTRQPGWLISVPRESLGAIQSRLVQLGATPLSAAVFDALRIEAGFPVMGVDLTEENLAHEAARKQRAISFTKGCYLGQEPIARLEAMGHTNRELRVLRIDAEFAPERGAAVLDQPGGVTIGTITSSAVLPQSRQGVAIALLRREAGAPGTVVSCSQDGSFVAARVEVPA